MKTGVRYQAHPGVVLGFHGTDKKAAERVLAGKAELKPSTNEYDWLGHGVYFWEYSPARAWEFAHEKKRRGEIETPAVIGAVIAPGVCLNLLESSALAELKLAYEMIGLDARENSGKLPENVGGEDFFKRYLDCAVVEMACRMRELAGTGPLSQVAGIKPMPPYETVRGAFWEGERLYPNAGFRQKNHVQLSVRDPSCIKGFFRVLADR
ncbi:MAG: hypothetical protein IT468_01670 [Rhodocyclaceae bacterium]|nr:hypothetical protein [Rhodocyclaceae bacterium]